jgi:flagellar basal-body rod modification protein FlgD
MALGTVTASASDIQMDYMKLLVTQLKSQDPESPMDSNQMVSQIAQLSQLQQAEALNAKFDKVLAFTECNFASSLVGKTVSFYQQADTGDTQLSSGVVEEVSTGNSSDEIQLLIGGSTIALSDVVSVKN